MMDGFPLYGSCKGLDAAVLTSCWRQTEGTLGDTMSHFYYDEAAFEAGECQLDQCGGALDANGTYAYYAPPNVPHITNCLMGTDYVIPCGFVPPSLD